MNVEWIKFRGHPCFKNDWSGFDAFRPITVIIGRNNTGKSRLLDFVRAICEGKALTSGWEAQVGGELIPERLQKAFPNNEVDTRIGHTLWASHGAPLIGAKIIAEFKGSDKVSSFQLVDPNAINKDLNHPFHRAAGIELRMTRLKAAIHSPNIPLQGRKFRCLLADRDIKPEAAEVGLNLHEDGRGANNIISLFLQTTIQKFPRERIHNDLRNALNQIFGNDGQFTEIEVKQHDESDGTGQPIGGWEVFLGEEKKGFVPLSRSGSGLKTVVLVLLNLIIVPFIEDKPKNHYVFVFEELENNLHPALLRRLLKYIDQYIIENAGYVFLTTHSSVMLDVFGASPHAQIISVTHDKEFAKAQTVRAHFDRQGVVTELGAKPSDLLQANGVVWVEGPSDRIYLNRWIELVSGSSLREGRDYICAFYGGALLAKDQFAAPEAANDEFSNLLRLNTNIVVICDSDRQNAGDALKDRVQRIEKEVGMVPGGIIWITATREIENYLSALALQRAFPDEAPPAPNQFERFFPAKAEGEASSFLERSLGRKSVDKVELAERTASHMTLDAMKERFDWWDKIQEIVRVIGDWNK